MSYASLKPYLSLRNELKTGPMNSPKPVQVTKMPDMKLLSSSRLNFLSPLSSIASSISGKTGIEIIPAAAPIIIRPRSIKAGLFSSPRDLDVPTKNMPVDIIIIPIKITALFGNLSVNKYINGLMAAYIMPGTAKHTPINAGEKPYFYMCTEKAGAMN